MAEDPTNPPSDAGATPQSGTPATGTPAPSGATPPTAAFSLEEAMKRIAELENSHKNAKEEAERHRKKLTKFEEAEKAAQEANLSEIERTKKQHADLQAQHDAYQRATQERIVRYEVERMASRLGIIDPDAAARLLDWSELEYDEDGTPKNAEKLLIALVKNKPYLKAPEPAQPNANQQSPAQQTPTIPAMNPGRSSIAAPAARTPGVKPSWNDVYKRPN